MEFACMGSKCRCARNNEAICKLFFGSSVRDDAADGILALEKNWQGPIVSNGGVASTLEISGNNWKQPILHLQETGVGR